MRKIYRFLVNNHQVVRIESETILEAKDEIKRTFKDAKFLNIELKV